MALPKIFYGWWVVTACFILSFYVSSVCFWGFTAFFTPLVKEFGWSYTQISFASSLRGLEMGIMAPLMGITVDRFGSRKIVLAAVVLIAAGLLVLSQTDNLTMYYLSVIFLGLGAGGCTSVVFMSAVAKWFSKRLGLALGIMASGYGASGLVIYGVVLIIDTFGWRETLIIESVIMLLIGLPLGMVVRDSPEKYGMEPDGAVSPPLKANETKPPAEPSLGLRAVWRSKPFISLFLMETVRYTSVSAVSLHVMPYLESLGTSRSMAGLVASGIPLFSILGRVGFGFLGDRIAKSVAYATSLAGIALGLFVFAWVGEIWTILLFLLLFPPGLGGGMVLRGSVIKERFGMAAFGSLLGAVMGGGALGGMIGSTLAGWGYDHLGGYQEIWIAFALLTAVTTWLARNLSPLSDKP